MILPHISVDYIVPHHPRQTLLQAQWILSALLVPRRLVRRALGFVAACLDGVAEAGCDAAEGVADALPDARHGVAEGVSGTADRVADGLAYTA